MSQISALYSALVGGQQSPTGGIGGFSSPRAPRFAAPAQTATPGQLAAFNRDSANYAEQARLQAEDEANLARMAVQRGAAPAPVVAPAQSLNPINAINRALTGGQ